jgi:hypothetical protein
VQTTVNDATLVEPFVNIMKLRLLPKQPRKPTGSKPRKKPGRAGAGDSAGQQGIKLPKVVPVRQDDKYWGKYGFTLDTGCHVISDAIELEGREQIEHVFYINLDNNSLRTEMKYSKQDPRLLEAKFKYGNVLLGLAMLHQAESDQLRSKASDTAEDRQTVAIQEQIRQVSTAVAPVLLPMIDQLAGLDEDDVDAFGMIGEDE